MKVFDKIQSFKTTCPHCKNRLEFEEVDIFETVYTSYTVCPVCSEKICVRKQASKRGRKQKEYCKDIEFVYDSDNEKESQDRERREHDREKDRKCRDLENRQNHYKRQYFLDDKDITSLVFDININFGTENNIHFSSIKFVDGREMKVNTDRVRIDLS